MFCFVCDYADWCSEFVCPAGWKQKHSLKTQPSVYNGDLIALPTRHVSDNFHIHTLDNAFLAPLFTEKKLSHWPYWLFGAPNTTTVVHDS